MIISTAKYGLFVELADLFIEGLVPIDTLRDDRYTWRENTHEIIGERWGRRFRAGDRVQVILDRILIQERRLQFSIVEEGLQLPGKKAARPAPLAFLPTNFESTANLPISSTGAATSRTLMTSASATAPMICGSSASSPPVRWLSASTTTSIGDSDPDRSE